MGPLSADTRAASSDRPARRRLSTLAIGLMLSCRAEAPLSSRAPPSLAGALEACDALAGERRDRCALVALQVAEQAPATDILRVCDALDDRDVVSRCYELANRAPGAPEGLCPRIDDPRLAASCALVAAKRTMNGPLDTALERCAEAGPLYVSCLSMLPESRKLLWTSQGVETMTRDILAIVNRFPGIQHREVFGYEVGFVAREVGAWPGERGPCGALPHGMGRLACEEGLRIGR